MCDTLAYGSAWHVCFKVYMSFMVLYWYLHGYSR
jgi:hypothetical protein